MAEFIDAFRHLDPQRAVILAVALLIAFGFEMVNGFHDTANAVTTVIYTRTLKPIPAVLFSGFCNFLGVLIGGTAIAFSIVHLLPVDLLISATSKSAIIMVLALLTAGIAWNLGTWWLGLPVSSSHTLIGAILGIGLANGLITGQGLGAGVNWAKAGEVGLALLVSPMIGFAAAAALLLMSKRLIPDPELYLPPPADRAARPPTWIRAVLITTCGGVSLAHGSNDGQKGMGLIMLVLIGLVPGAYALNLHAPAGAKEAREAAGQLKMKLTSFQPAYDQFAVSDLDEILEQLEGKTSLREIPPEDRWRVRTRIFEMERRLDGHDSGHHGTGSHELDRPRHKLRGAIEYVPTWVVVGVALCLGIGTTIGYERIVVTVAEKIGRDHLTYAQGAAAELVAMTTIGLADAGGLPVSTTQVLSSGIAGTMSANGSGIQAATIRKIALAWLLTFPVAMLLSASLFYFGTLVIGP